MNEEISGLTLGKLKETIEQLEKQGANADTKILLDTGWESLQEITNDGILLKEARLFTILDPLTQEPYHGFTLKDSSAHYDEIGEKETVIVIENRY